MGLLYPTMRRELFEYLEWLSRAPSPSSEKDQEMVDHVVHFFFDDTGLADDPLRAVGAFLYDRQEAVAVARVVAEIDQILLRYGTERPNRFYLQAPEWAELTRLAGDTYRRLVTSDTALEES
ncbi:MAG: hypothetical protein CMN30_22050 [Sandaracinus sp.]|nr:hypothetical protein [Sandaracinus sp.]